MKKTLFSFALLVFVFNSKSQDWVEYMQRPDANLYQAQTLFNNYWEGKDITQKGNGYKVFKRFENFAEPRVYPSGDLSLLGQTGPNYETWLEQYLADPPPVLFNNNNNNENNIISSSTWTAMGPFGAITGSAGGQLLKAGRLNFVAIHPTNTLNIYVGAPAGGFWRSTDGGTTWTTNTDGLSVNGCSDLAIDPTNPNIMYLAMGDGDAGDTRSIGVLKSLDGGTTWNTTGLTFPVTSNNLIRRLIINPSNPQIVLAATNSGIRRTTNGGTSWTVVQASNCYDLEFQPGNPNVVYAAGAAFRKSTDGGATWTLISSGIPTTGVSRMAIAVTPADVNRVYVLAGNTTNYGFQGFYQSTNAGTTFAQVPTSLNLLGWSSTGGDSGGQAWYDLCIAASPTNANEVVTGGVNVWRTTNAGGSWSLYGHWTGSGAPFTHADHHDLEYAPNGTLFNANDGTVYRRAPGAGSWTEISGTMNISQIYKIGTSALTANKWISGHQDNGTSQWTGTTYSACLGGDGMDCFIDRTNNNNMFGEYYNGAFRRSTNGGSTWSAYTTGLTGTAPWVTPWKQDPQTANTIYAGRSNMFRSVLGTGSWTMMTALPAGGTVKEFAVAPSNSLVIYVLKSSAIYKTVNGGSSWTTITTGVPVGSASPEFIVISPTDPNKAWVMLSGYSAGNKVYQTTNGGSTWTNYSSNLPNIPANCGVYQVGSNDRIYVGMDVGVYYRDNTQANWTLYNTGLPNTPVSDMEISPADPTKLIAATYGRGVWKVDVITSLAPISAFNYSGTPCSGSPIVFNDVSINGPTTWTWSVLPSAGVNINTPSAQNPTITFANGGTYSVTLATSNGNGPGTPSTQTISIGTTPTVVISNSVQTICSGNSATINSTGALSYSWSTGATTSSIAVSPTATSVYTVTGTSGACTSAPKTATVNIGTTPTVSVNSPSICSGNNALMTASGASSYSWSTGPTTNTLSVSPLVTTIYTVTGSNGTCSDTKTSTVTVNTTPTVVISNSLQTICSGSTTNINASGASTYSWSNGGTTSVIAVNPSVTTVYTLTGMNGTCVSSAKTATINVNLSPTVTVNSPSICAGSSVVLTASGASTYSWNSGPTTSTIGVSPGSTTVYTVTGSNGICSDAKTSTVTVLTTPTIVVSNNSQTICAGSTTSINASGVSTYSWSNGGSTSVIAVSPTATSIYTVNGSIGACAAAAKTATVVVSNSIIVTVNNATLCSGNTTVLMASGASSYSWSTGGLTSTINVSPSVTTVYTVTGSSGTCNDTKTSTVTVNTTPTVVISNSVQTICSGSVVNINASGASTYSWSNGSTFSFITVSPSVTTVYTVTGTNGTCSGTAKTATVNVNTTPTVAVNSATMCSGNNVILTASGASSYSWNTGPTTNTISVSPGSTTIYTVTGNNGTCSDAKTSTVTVNITPTVVISNSVQTICSGSTVNINATGATSYSWSNGATTSGIAVSPSVSMVYTVTGTNGSCTGLTKTATVNVNPSPTVAVNNGSVCSGNSVTLSASGASTYSWNTGPTTNSISVSPMVTTVYTVTGSNGSCTDVKTSTVTVTASPTIVISGNNQNICSGETVTISASGASSYLWNTSSTSSSISASPLVTTVYTVSGLNGICQDTKTATINVTTTPTVSVNNDVICAGDNAVLTATGAPNYSWSTGPNTNPITVSPSVTTVYTVTGSNGNCNDTKTSTVTVNPLPVINTNVTDTTICRSNEITLSASGAITYTWQPVNLNGATINDNPLASTIYTVTGTDANNCVNSETISVTVEVCAGITKNGSEAVEFNVFPNPASDYIKIQYPGSGAAEILIELTDAAGKLILTKQQRFTRSDSECDIKLTNVARGVYFIKLTGKEGSSKTIKLIKE